MDEKNDQSKVNGDVQDSNEEKPGLISDDDPTFLVRPEVLKGRLIGDEHVRYEISRQSAFKRISAGLLEATEVTQAPHGTWNVSNACSSAPHLLQPSKSRNG